MLVKEIKVIPIQKLEGFNKEEFNVESFTHSPVYLSELDAETQLKLCDLTEKFDEICYAIVQLADGSWNTVTHYLNNGHIGFVLFNACYVKEPSNTTIHAVAFENKEEKKYHTNVHLEHKKGKIWY